ncbi:uncharacterized protein LOC6578306 [Drosophila mojavensis]|uniref:Glycosyltransferase family 92 protein n=1 Tax=Drosophila mojavensis TaxID=7230 RepID=B4KQI7_DROMO|nr:uncharacterized protein LOC6578306 [Drosophila mojavensis]EDW08156.1 uncharacterized protein Dmoj_GI19725 [Drosophila mojavensis]
MRKYQQLALLLISCFSVGVLMMYKSENNRLKYVLRYVNFFGRNDAAVLRRIQNSTTAEDEERQSKWVFTKPLPVWQVIGDSFYAYSAYWKQKELVVGGEAHVIVVGKKGAVVDFRCSFDVGGRSVQGKFRFQRDAAEGVVDDKASTFTNYNFFCQVSRNFGQPKYVSFSDATSPIKRQVKLHLRHLKPAKTAAKATTTTAAAVPAGATLTEVPVRFPATICVDLVSFDVGSRFARNVDAMVQFFLFHQALGVQHFLVYNYDELPEQVVRLLERTKMHLYSLPFNFPFLQTNGTAARIRQLLQTDCLLRNVNYASFTMLLAPNELVYPNARFAGNLGKSSLQRQLRAYESETVRFELSSFAVCFDERKKLLIDNVQYDPELRSKVLLYRLELPAAQLLLPTAKGVELPLSSGFAHRYVECQQVGADGLHDWRTGVREDLMEHITQLRSEVDLLI